MLSGGHGRSGGTFDWYREVSRGSGRRESSDDVETTVLVILCIIGVLVGELARFSVYTK